MILIGNFAPALARAQVWHSDVAGDFGDHLGQLDLVGDRLEQFENRRAANDGDRRVASRGDGAVDVMNNFDALNLPFRVVGHDDVAAAGKDAGQAVECLAPHNHRAAHGQLLEALQIAGNVPGKLSVLADNPVDGAGEDDGDRGAGHGRTLPLAAAFAKPLPMVRVVLAMLLAAAAPAAAETVQLRAGHLIDPGTGTVTHDRELIMTDGKIVSDLPWRGVRADRKLIDWSGKWVLPGLIDMHTHVADGYGQGDDPAEPLKHSAAETALKGAETARITLHAGFTTVRDVGVYRGLSDVALRDAIAKGEVEGPRMIVAGGYITIPGGGGAVTGAKPGTVIGPEFRIGEVRSPQEARDRVKAMIKGGADFIKLNATGAVLAIGSEPGPLELTPEMMNAACDQAKALGKYCIAHAHGAQGVKAAIEAGARTIEHASLIDDEGLRMAKQRGVWLDMDIYDGDWIDEVGTRDHWPAEYLRKNRETTDVQRTGFAKAVKLGVPLTYGTDAGVYPHALNARQFGYMVRYGMTPMQALASATSEAAKALGRDDLGSVKPGHVADLVAVSRNPLDDVSVLQCMDGVVQGGRQIHRDDAAERCDRWKR